LRQFPPGTLGAELAAFLDTRHLNFLPQYETHDAIHLLLNYDTTVTGELRLQAFMLGNGSASFAGRVLLILGFILLPELWAQLKKDFSRGRKSARIAVWDIRHLLGVSKETLTSKIAGV
jgi:ubiquinone biosynthesis protein Coq4